MTRRRICKLGSLGKRFYIYQPDLLERSLAELSYGHSL